MLKLWFYLKCEHIYLILSKFTRNRWLHYSGKSNAIIKDMVKKGE